MPPKRLTKSQLEAAGIEFFEETEDIEDILETILSENAPAYHLAKYFLDFTNLISQENWEDLEPKDRKGISRAERNSIVISKPQPSESKTELYESFNEKYRIQQCNLNFKQALSIRRKAVDVESEEEERWKEVIKESVFSGLRNQARKLGASKKKRTPADVIARFRFESEHTWQLGQKIMETYTKESFNPISAPKADAFLSFHAHERNMSDGGSLRQDDYIQNFSQTRLIELYEKSERMNRQENDWNCSFTPSPSRSFYTAANNKDRICFPWAICEIKHQGHINNSEEQFLFCQAANGAAVSLTLLANAAAAGFKEPPIHEIRPVVVFTFTGPRMRCIWQGSLTDIVDNIKLCVILERLQFWAINHLRPWLSSCIDQWRRFIDSYDEESSGEESETETEKEVREQLQIALDWIDRAEHLVDGRQLRHGLEPLRQAIKTTAENRIEAIHKSQTPDHDIPIIGIRRAETIESYISDAASDIDGEEAEDGSGSDESDEHESTDSDESLSSE